MYIIYLVFNQGESRGIFYFSYSVSNSTKLIIAIILIIPFLAWLIKSLYTNYQNQETINFYVLNNLTNIPCSSFIGFGSSCISLKTVVMILNASSTCFLLFSRLAIGLLLTLLFKVPQRLADGKGVLLLEGLAGESKSSFSLSGSSETSSYVLLDTICLGTFCLLKTWRMVNPTKPFSCRQFPFLTLVLLPFSLFWIALRGFQFFSSLLR